MAKTRNITLSRDGGNREMKSWVGSNTLLVDLMQKRVPELLFYLLARRFLICLFVFNQERPPNTLLLSQMGFLKKPKTLLLIQVCIFGVTVLPRGIQQWPYFILFYHPARSKGLCNNGRGSDTHLFFPCDPGTSHWTLCRASQSTALRPPHFR